MTEFIPLSVYAKEGKCNSGGPRIPREGLPCDWQRKERVRFA